MEKYKRFLIKWIQWRKTDKWINWITLNKMLIQKSKKITYNNQIKYNCFKHTYTHTHTRGSMQSTTGVKYKYVRQLSQSRIYLVFWSIVTEDGILE